MSRDRQRQRRSIRLPGYDYAQPGAYFVTIVTHGRQPLFGDVVDQRMSLNDLGRIVHTCWLDLPRHYHGLSLDAFVVMPNHVHGVLILTEDGIVEPESEHAVDHSVGAGFKPAPTMPSVAPPTRQPGTGSQIDAVGPHVETGRTGNARHALPEIVRAFKTFSARRTNEVRDTRGVPVWQRGYYEHIVRSDASLDRIRHYIASNPSLWNVDPENPVSVSAAM